MRFRHYDPTPGMCRWLKRDPAGYQDGPSLYSYLGRNPMAGTDPYGLASQVLMLQIIRTLELHKRAQGRVRFVPGQTVDGGFQLDITIEEEDPTLVTEFGVIQLAKYELKGEIGVWVVDDGRLGSFSDKSPDPPYYDKRVPVRRIGARGFERGKARGNFILTDTPSVWDPLDMSSLDFLVVVVATKGTAAGHVYGVYSWSWPLGDPEGAPLQVGRVVGPWYPREAEDLLRRELPFVHPYNPLPLGP